MQQYFHAGRGLLKCRKRRRQYLCCGRWRVADVQLTIIAASQGADLFHRFIGALEQFAHFLQKEFSLGGERYAARAASQKVHADLIFQVLYLPAQRGLSDPKLRSGPGEVQCFTHGEKISQMPQFHRCVPLCRKSMAAQSNEYWAPFKRGGKLLT